MNGGNTLQAIMIPLPHHQISYHHFNPTESMDKIQFVATAKSFDRIKFLTEIQIDWQNLTLT
jgi:hypothetical protein